MGTSAAGRSGWVNALVDNLDAHHISLDNLTVPTLVIGAAHDTMDPAHMQAMAERLPNGRYLECPNGSHLAMYDDTEVYMRGLLDFLTEPITA